MSLQSYFRLPRLTRSFIVLHWEQYTSLCKESTSKGSACSSDAHFTAAWGQTSNPGPVPDHQITKPAC
eukprot:46737-Eustigmatos_ZCMA.PRE.1